MLTGEGEEEMVHCPYNIAHVLLKSRLPKHLIKCRQNYTLEKFTTCPFNSTHDVPETQLQSHVRNCPDRKGLENFVYVIGESKPQDFVPHLDVSYSSENWDEEESPGVSYLDVKDKRLENQKVFREPVGMSKAQRKAFFQNEVKKFARQEQESDQDESMMASTSSNSASTAKSSCSKSSN